MLCLSLCLLGVALGGYGGYLYGKKVQDKVTAVVKDLKG